MIRSIKFCLFVKIVVCGPQDADQVKCLSFHPTGDFIVVGTNHHVIRLYDVHTAQAFVCNIPNHQHTSGITTIK